jgi:AraC-like DNA-binding protein
VRLASIAGELGLSQRTLQRKLSEAGASFQQVLDGARHALARDYLRQRGLSLADIAFLLGYQEQSAFTHAFREWSGMNPGAWRERALAGVA